MRFRPLLFALCALLVASIAAAQPVSYQGWQSATISSGAITVSCYELLLPHIKGSLLSEPSPTTTCGELCQALSSSHPVKVAMTAEGGGPTDSLTAINGCTLDGARVSLSPVSGDTITVEDTPGVIELPDDVDIVLDSPIKILTLQRKDGVWVADGGVGSSGGGGNVIIADGAKLDFADPSSDDATEGLFIPGATSCANFIGARQLCYDTDDDLICVGNGTGITCLSVAQCADSVDCINNTIVNIQTNPFIVVDNNNDGFRMRIGAGGPVFECVQDIGGTEVLCTPSEIKTFAFVSGVADETQCIRSFDVTVNDLTVPIGYHCLDNDTGPGGTIVFAVPMPDRWDGATLVISAFLHSNETTPGGDLNFDWVGFCSEHSAGIADANFPAATANSEMVIDLDSISTDEQATGTTVGDIPLSNCTSANAKVLWLEATMDETSTTASDLTDQILFGFKGEYGLKAYTD